jgi:hypothetical protein
VVLDEESREWLRCLAGTGRDGRHTVEREEALARLHELLLRAAHADLRRRSRPGGVEGRERDDLAHQAADDALLAITSKLDRFRGDSRFATCAYKFVMFEVSAKLGRHHWRNPPVQAGDDAWERIPDRFGAERPAAPRLRRDRRRRDPARRATRSTRRCSTRGERSARTWSLTDTWTTKNRGRHDRMARAR